MKNIYLTINSEIAKNENTTHGGLVRICKKFSNSKFIDGNGKSYDFKNNRIRVMDFNGKTFYNKKWVNPDAELWVFYSDGYTTKTNELGYSKPTDYHERLMKFIEKQIQRGNIGKVINTPETERKTLKKYFKELNPQEFGIIPTYTFTDFEELYEKFKEKGSLVAKPDWGGAMKGVELIKSEETLLKYRSSDFSDLVFQDYNPGIEKRMWVVRGKFVEGRIIKNRDTPWKSYKRNSLVDYYNLEKVKLGKIGISEEEFKEDLENVKRIVKKTGLEIGSVDFLGKKINELNGAGTGYTSSDRLNTIKIDARKYLFNYIKNLLEI